MAGIAKKCPCLRPKIDDEVRALDYRHSNLHDVPGDVFNKERTLEELCVDTNRIRDLPRELFFCHGLRKLSISDNELTSIPPAISSLTNLEELDFSKNGIIDVPDSIKGCKYLRTIDASINPLGKLPEGFTYLPNLTHLYMNDTCLDYLPGSCGRMSKLKIFELRENHLKTLPRSFGRLADLERLDIGNNEFSELNDVLSGLGNLLELWCDNNQIATITRGIGRLKHLMFLDVSHNQLQELPEEIDGCVSLADLHITTNNLVELPDSIGNLGNLITLKVDDNQLAFLPRTLGGMSSLSELNVSINDLEDLPPSIGLLRNLRTFYADDNLLQFIPAEIGSCSGITVLSLRCNKLTYIPDELGRISRLRVLNLSDNLIRHLPFSIIKLKELQALWLTENQTRPLIPLQSDYEAGTGRKILTCYLLPQGELKGNDATSCTEDNQSFHASMWDEERLNRQQIHFAFPDGSDEEGTLVRCPTPHPKDMRQKARHAQSLTMKPIVNAASSRSNEDALDEADTCSLISRKTSNEKQHPGLGHSKLPGQSDVRARENHSTKAISQKLQETHRFYSHDKEFLLKDKVRVQHRLSVPDFDTGLNRLLKDVQNTSKKGDTRLPYRSGSVPDMSWNGKKPTSATNSSRTLTLPVPSTHEDQYNKQNVHQRRGRRSRRMREYDSDTDYRSDYEPIRFKDLASDNSSQGANFEVLSVQSQPLPHHYSHHDKINDGWRQPTRCVSDLKGYNGEGSFQTANAAAAAFQRKYQNQFQFPNQSQSYSTVPSRTGTSDSTQNFRPNSRLNRELYSHDPGMDMRPHWSRGRDFEEDARSRIDYLTNSTDNKDARSRIDYLTNSTDNKDARSRIDYLTNSTDNKDARSRIDYLTNSTDNLNNNTTGNINNTVSKDKLYKHAANSENYSSIQMRTKNVHPTISNPYSFNQKSTIPVHANSTTTSFQPHLTSGPTLQIPAGPEPQPQKQTPPLPHNGVDMNHPPVLSDKSILNNSSHSIQSLRRLSRSPTPSLPASQNGSFVDQNAPLLSSAPLSLAESTESLNYSDATDRRGSKLCTVLEERSASQTHLHSGKSPSSRQSPAVTPPYSSSPAYRRSLGSKSLLPHTNGQSSDSTSLPGDSPRSSIHFHDSPRSSINVHDSSRGPPHVHDSSRDPPHVHDSSRGPPHVHDSPRSSINVHDSSRGPPHVHDSAEEASPLISSSTVQNLIVNQSKPSSCGFHGSSPYQDLPSPTREKISFTNYADADRRKQTKRYDRHAYKTYGDNQSSRSSSNSSQIGSASQIRSAYSPGVGVDAAEKHSHSDSSDSQCDARKVSSSHAFNSPDHAYSSSHPCSDDDRPHDSSIHSFDNGNYDELSMIPNQEQSSQVSSSTDSGYSHGHHVYELIGDHLITKCEKYSNQGDQRSEELEITSAGSPQRSLPLKSSGRISSRDTGAVASPSQELKDQFRFTIKKNPGLGFSIAGGIGSHGNPFREKDIGIFVTKVIPEGPASRRLRPGDKILEVNKVDFKIIEHNQAVAVLKKNSVVTLLIERVQRVNVV